MRSLVVQLVAAGALLALPMLSACAEPPNDGATEDEAAERTDAENKALELATAAENGGALGVHFDDATQQYAVVLPASGGATFRLADVARLGIPVRVEMRAIDKADIAEITQRLTARDWHPDAKNYGVAFYFDPSLGKVVIHSAAPAEVYASLLAQYGDKVTLENHEVAFNSRNADGAPHWGGAEINDGTWECTSSFTVHNKSTGTKYMVTAGHCFDLNKTIRGGTGLAWGTVKFRAFPTLDIELVGGSTYGAEIYVGGSTGTGEAVSSASDPVAGANYCSSGIKTAETCSHKCISTSATVCVEGDCFSNMIAYKGGTAPIQGDSGMPIYIKGTNPNYTYMRGIETASDGVTSYGVKWSTISSHYNVGIN